MFLGKQVLGRAAKLRAPDPWSSVYQRLGRARTGEQSQILVLAAHLALAQPGPSKVTPILNWVVRVVSPSQALQGPGQHLFRLLSWGGCTSSSICFIFSSPPNAPERLQPCLTPPCRSGGCQEASQGRTRGFIQALQLLLPPSRASPTLPEPQMC